MIYQVAMLTLKKSAIELTKPEHQLNHLKAKFSQAQNREKNLMKSFNWPQMQFNIMKEADLLKENQGSML